MAGASGRSRIVAVVVVTSGREICVCVRRHEAEELLVLGEIVRVMA